MQSGNNIANKAPYGQNNAYILAIHQQPNVVYSDGVIIVWHITIWSDWYTFQVFAVQMLRILVVWDNRHRLRPLQTLCHGQGVGVQEANILNTKIHCKFFQNIFHSSDRRLYSERPGSNFTNNHLQVPDYQVARDVQQATVWDVWWGQNTTRHLKDCVAFIFQIVGSRSSSTLHPWILCKTTIWTDTDYNYTNQETIRAHHLSYDA